MTFTCEKCGKVVGLGHYEKWNERIYCITCATKISIKTYPVKRNGKTILVTVPDNE